jgi:hypothetical protein
MRMREKREKREKGGLTRLSRFSRKPRGRVPAPGQAPLLPPASSAHAQGAASTQLVESARLARKQSASALGDLGDDHGTV